MLYLGPEKKAIQQVSKLDSGITDWQQYYQQQPQYDQDQQQHDRYRQPGLCDFTEYVSIEYAKHGYIRDFPGI